MAVRIAIPKYRSASRAPLALLGAMLLASVLIAGFTLRLLAAQDALLQDALIESDSQALALLANRVEHALLAALRGPFQALGDAALGESLAQRLPLAAREAPHVRRILLLDPRLRGRNSWSRGVEPGDRQLEQWLSQRVAAEARGVEPTTLHAFVEEVSGRPTLLALQAASARDADQGWILVSFDLPAMVQQLVDPLLREFAQERGGRVELQGPDAPWDEAVLHQPLTGTLPGWLLAYRPNVAGEQRIVTHSRNLLIGVSAGAVLALLLATYAAWRPTPRAGAGHAAQPIHCQCVP